MYAVTKSATFASAAVKTSRYDVSNLELSSTKDDPQRRGRSPLFSPQTRRGTSPFACHVSAKDLHTWAQAEILETSFDVRSVQPVQFTLHASQPGGCALME